MVQYNKLSYQDINISVLLKASYSIRHLIKKVYSVSGNDNYVYVSLNFRSYRNILTEMKAKNITLSVLFCILENRSKNTCRARGSSRSDESDNLFLRMDFSGRTLDGEIVGDMPHEGSLQCAKFQELIFGEKKNSADIRIFFRTGIFED